MEMVDIQPALQAACGLGLLFVMYSFLPQLVPPWQQCTHPMELTSKTLVYGVGKVLIY